MKSSKMFTFLCAVVAVATAGHTAGAQNSSDMTGAPFSLVAPACTVTAGVVTAPSAGSNCHQQPDIQTITLYKVVLCSAKPTAPKANAATDISACKSIFQKDAGQAITVSKTATTPLDSASTHRPDNATYSYVYVEASDTMLIKGKATFNKSMGDSNGLTTGSTCWSVALTGGFFNWSNNTQGSMPLATKCGTATDATYASTTVIWNSFDGASFVNAITNLPLSNGGTTAVTNSVDAFLLSSTGFLATPTGAAVNLPNGVARLGAIMKLPTAVTVSDATAGFTLSYNNSLGTQISTQTLRNAVQNVSKFGSGPFDMTFTLR